MFLQPLSRSVEVEEESCADQVRPSVSAAWPSAVSRWGGRIPRSLLVQHPPRGPWAPRERLRVENKMVSSHKFTVTVGMFVGLMGQSPPHRMFHSGKWKVTQKTLLEMFMVSLAKVFTTCYCMLWFLLHLTAITGCKVVDFIQMDDQRALWQKTC